MKAKEIREKGKDDLVKLEAKFREELAMARMQLLSNQLSNTAKIANLKKELSRILTIRQQG